MADSLHSECNKNHQKLILKNEQWLQLNFTTCTRLGTIVMARNNVTRSFIGRKRISRNVAKLLQCTIVMLHCMYYYHCTTSCRCIYFAALVLICFLPMKSSDRLFLVKTIVECVEWHLKTKFSIERKVYIIFHQWLELFVTLRWKIQIVIYWSNSVK